MLCELGTGSAHLSRTWCVLFGDFSEEGSLKSPGERQKSGDHGGPNAVALRL